MKEGPVEDQQPEVSSPHDAFRIALPNFEGPLDLLLHLIREHQVDILDIPISLITEKYLAYLERMKEIDLDIAGEFLVMASTLLHLKSRLLLPQDKVEAEEALAVDPGDPRAELVRRLLEYQKYKDAAEQMAQNDLLDRDVFPRRVRVDRVPFDADEVGLSEMSVFKLIEALDRVLKALEPKFQHEILRERLSLSEAMHKIADALRGKDNVSFYKLFEGSTTRGQVIITFLAILEMCKMKLIQVRQDEEYTDLLVNARGDALEGLGTQAEEIVRDEYQ